MATAKTDEPILKRGRGRPPKERLPVRAKNDPLAKWRAEKELEKAGGDPLVAIAEEHLAGDVVVPKGLDELSKKHFLILYREFKALDIDMARYYRLHVLLAKTYALEEVCEKELHRIGGITYKVSGTQGLVKEHPAVKFLMATRSQILTMLKVMGLTPTTGNSATRFEREIESDFATIQ